MSPARSPGTLLDDGSLLVYWVNWGMDSIGDDSWHDLLRET